MSEPDRPAVFVHLLPGLIPPGALKGSVAVVVDVLRATTVMVHALASGCAAVIPCGEIEEARRIAADLPAGSALLAGERHGLPIEGFDLGNSPGEFTPEVCRGKTLVMTTTNGTRAILASLDAERVLVAAFSNFGMTVQWLHAEDRDIHIVCAGTEGEISFEDALLAGAYRPAPHATWEGRSATTRPRSSPGSGPGSRTSSGPRAAIATWRRIPWSATWSGAGAAGESRSWR